MKNTSRIFYKQRMDFILADTACFQLRKHALKNMRKARYVIKRTDRFELFEAVFPPVGIKGDVLRDDEPVDPAAIHKLQQIPYAILLRP